MVSVAGVGDCAVRGFRAESRHEAFFFVGVGVVGVRPAARAVFFEENLLAVLE